MSSLGNGVDIYVADRPVEIAPASSSRAEIVIRAEGFDLWYGGDSSVRAGTRARKIKAGTSVRLKITGSIWAVRMAGEADFCAIEEDFK